MAERIPNAVAKLVVFRAYLASDHVTPATGKTIAITISKNGGAFGNPNAGATNATEISSGFYKFTLDTTDTGTNGPVAWRGAVATVDDAGDVYEVTNATNAGFTGIPNAVAGAANGLLISGSNSGTTTFGALTVTGATTLTGAVALQSTLGITGAVTLSSTLGVGAVTFAGFTTGAISATTIASSGTVTLNALTVTNATTLSGAVSLGSTLGVTGTTTFAAINTGTITTTGNWAVSGTATVTGGIVANITGNLSGSIGSYTGNTPQTGDSFVRIGAAGAGLTAITGATLSAAYDAAKTASSASAVAAVAAQLPAALTAGGMIKADILYVNGHAVTGDGHTGTEWGPA